MRYPPFDFDFTVHKHTRHGAEWERTFHGVEEYSFINLVIKVPSGKLSDAVRMLNYLKTKFEKVDVKVEISAQKGRIKTKEYKEKIEEAIRQSQMEIEKEEIS